MSFKILRKLARLRAFWLGFVEFKDDWTTHFTSLTLIEDYDWGRDLAHRLTLRHFDN